MRICRDTTHYLGVGKLDMFLGVVVDEMPVLGLHKNLLVVDIHCCACKHCCLQTQEARPQEVSAESLACELRKLNYY